MQEEGGREIENRGVGRGGQGEREIRGVGRGGQ